MAEDSDLRNRFMYHAPKEGQAERYQGIREEAYSLADLVNRECPESREKSLAFTHIEDAVMWANAAIARHE